VVEEDLAQRGIPASALLPGVRRLARGAVARLFAEYDRVLHF
jgi:hypothetical protein